MPENNHATPEKDLLNLIENKDEGSSSAGKKVIRRGGSLFSLGAIRGRFSFLKTNFKDITSGGLSLDLKSINRILIIVVLTGVFLLGFDFFNAMVGLEEQVEASFTMDKEVAPFQFQGASNLKNSSYYLEKARKRDIFKMVSKIEHEAFSPAAAVKKQVIKEIVKKTENLKLVGVSWSNDPDAMIEDENLKKTFFVKRGSLINDVKVEAIFKDKVVLSYEGDEVELK